MTVFFGAVVVVFGALVVFGAVVVLGATVPGTVVATGATVVSAATVVSTGMVVVSTTVVSVGMTAVVGATTPGTAFVDLLDEEQPAIATVATATAARAVVTIIRFLIPLTVPRHAQRARALDGSRPGPSGAPLKDAQGGKIVIGGRITIQRPTHRREPLSSAQG